MIAVHAFVAEVLSNFIDTLETAHDETLQIEFGGDAHVHVLVQGIEMRDERTCRSTSCNHLQCRGLHFGVAGLIEHLAHSTQYGGTLQERVLHALVHYEVDITLTITQFGIVKFVVGNAILVLHDGKGLQRFRQQREFLGMNRDFARLCTEHVTLHTNEIADVEQALEHHVVHIFVFVGTQFVARHVDLDTAFRVLYLGKRCLTHHAAAHHAACDAHLWQLFGSQGLLAFGDIDFPRAILYVISDFCAESIRRIFCGRVGVDAHLTQFLKTLSANNLLFAQFKYVHKNIISTYKQLQRYKEKVKRERLFRKNA